jgi:hypothetical protein
VPQLSPSLRALVDRRPFSFAEFRRNPPERLPESLRDELDNWLKRIFVQFREFELQSIMSSLKHSLAVQAADAEPVP